MTLPHNRRLDEPPHTDLVLPVEAAAKQRVRLGTTVSNRLHDTHDDHDTDRWGELVAQVRTLVNAHDVVLAPDAARERRTGPEHGQESPC